MNDPIARFAECESNVEALWTSEGPWTYGELNVRVESAAEAMREAGIRPGMRVAMRHPRSVDTIISLWALWRRGAVAVPLSGRLPAREVGRRVQDIDAGLLITAEETLAQEVSDEIPVASPAQFVRRTRGATGSIRSPRTQRVDRPATIVYTSGTTGSPKAALHTWRNHVYSAKGSNANIPLRRGDRWLLSLPLYHVGGLAILFRCALAGASVAVPLSGADLRESLDRSAATHTSLVTTQLRRLLREGPTARPGSLRAVLVGGGPLPPPLLGQAVDRGWPLHTTYGCTEMASQVTATPPGAPFDDLRTAGRRLPHRKIRVEDEQIQVAGATLFAGYVTPDGLEDPRTESGWYPTGDRGSIDASGRLHVLGRMDRMFVSGGENVQPEEIEAALEGLDGVTRAVVVGVPDPTYGMRPVAFVDGHEQPKDLEVEDVLADVLPRFKIPDACYSLPQDAVDGNGEVDRGELERRARMLRNTASKEVDNES